jgi:limonene-1,2-epoxide hydrolase
MSAEAIELVTEFCATWESVDIDALMEFFADGAVYHNIPIAPVHGKDAIRTTIEGFVGGINRIEFEILNIAANGDNVLTERVDTFYGDKTISLPVMGTFEVVDGKIAAWRDYFDLNQFMSQMAG